jgi:hypothetical protein
VTPDELDAPLPEQSWWSTWEHDESPQAKAYTLLKGLGLDCGLNRPGEKAGRINFVEGGYHPGSSEHFVELRDDLSVSLLQARLIEGKLPIRLVIDEEHTHVESMLRVTASCRVRRPLTEKFDASYSPQLREKNISRRTVGS